MVLFTHETAARWWDSKKCYWISYKSVLQQQSRNRIKNVWNSRGIIANTLHRSTSSLKDFVITLHCLCFFILDVQETSHFQFYHHKKRKKELALLFYYSLTYGNLPRKKKKKGHCDYLPIDIFFLQLCVALTILTFILRITSLYHNSDFWVYM